jgi:hypothetical protein
LISRSIIPGVGVGSGVLEATIAATSSADVPPLSSAGVLAVSGDGAALAVGAATVAVGGAGWVAQADTSTARTNKVRKTTAFSPDLHIMVK